jgi:ketosteroid isomerase-like protein
MLLRARLRASSWVLAIGLAAVIPAPVSKCEANTRQDAIVAPSPILDVPEEARSAVATVERFSTALAAGDLHAAAEELAPETLVLESGSAERSAAEYLAGHAGHDAEFLRTARVELKHRRARVAGGMAWIGSESEMHYTLRGKQVVLLSTETMVLQLLNGTWKIVHIHWSSRRRTA